MLELNGGSDIDDGKVLNEVKSLGDYSTVMRPSFDSCKNIPIRVISTLPLSFQAKAQSLSRQEKYIARSDPRNVPYMLGEKAEKLLGSWKKHQYYIQTDKGDNKLMNFRLQNTGAKNLAKILKIIMSSS